MRIALRLVLLVGWAALAAFRWADDDSWGFAVTAFLFVGSAILLWTTLRSSSTA